MTSILKKAQELKAAREWLMKDAGAKDEDLLIPVVERSEYDKLAVKLELYDKMTLTPVFEIVQKQAAYIDELRESTLNMRLQMTRDGEYFSDVMEERDELDNALALAIATLEEISKDMGTDYADGNTMLAAETLAKIGALK